MTESEAQRTGRRYRSLKDGELTPVAGARFAPTTFDEWFVTQRQEAAR